MVDYCSFFSAENIARIDAWTSHPEHPAGFRIRRTEKADSVVVSITSYGDRFKAVISPVMEAHGIEWPMADQ